MHPSKTEHASDIECPDDHIQGARGKVAHPLCIFVAPSTRGEVDSCTPLPCTTVPLTFSDLALSCAAHYMQKPRSALATSAPSFDSLR